jgi:hypothetical protein
MWNKNQQDFIAKKKQNKIMTKKIPKINVEQTKSNRKLYLYVYPLGT